MIIFVDRNVEMVKAWEDAFSPLEGAERDGFKIVEGSIFDVGASAIVSPANSFGFMDGGLDQAILDNLGKEVQTYAQKSIAAEYDGELLVGQAKLVQTGNAKIPFIIVAPTMRVPMDIRGTANAYLAMRGIMMLLRSISSILPGPVAVSGLGTGVGKLAPRDAARQMYVAYAQFALKKWWPPSSWYEALKMHQKLVGD